MSAVIDGRPEDIPGVLPAPLAFDAPPATADTPAVDPTEAERWDFARVALVVCALVGVTVFLALHYTSEKDAAGMLGIVVPVLTAIIGLKLGYQTGSTAGMAQGMAAGQADKAKAVREGRQALAQHLLDLTSPEAGPERTGQDATIGHVRAALGAVKAE